MESLKVPNGLVIPTFNSLYGLQRWMRPGAVSFMLGAYIDGLRSPAERLQAEYNRLRDEMAKKYPEGHERAGEPCIEVNELGQQVTRFPDPETARLWAERNAELFSGELELHIPRKLTLDDLAAIEKNISAKAEAALDMPDLSLVARFVNF